MRSANSPPETVQPSPFPEKSFHPAGNQVEKNHTCDTVNAEAFLPVK
jgi:hypothetical protein